MQFDQYHIIERRQSRSSQWHEVRTTSR